MVADARMPRLDGLHLTRELMGPGAPPEGDIRHIRFLLLASKTAKPPYEPGVSAVLVKPFNRRQLRRGVGEALAARPVPGRHMCFLFRVRGAIGDIEQKLAT